MSRDDDFDVRLGRVRNQGRGVNKPFVGRVLASAHKAGGLSTGRRRGSRSTFGRGRAARFGTSAAGMPRVLVAPVRALLQRSELPLQRVVVSTSGLAQFTHAGTAAAGNARRRVPVSGMEPTAVRPGREPAKVLAPLAPFAETSAAPVTSGAESA